MPDPAAPSSDAPSWSAETAYDTAAQAAKWIADLSGVARHDVAVVLGTGLADAATALGPVHSRHQTGDVPGMPPSFVPHQRSEVWSVQVGDRRVLVFLGRLHLYEGYEPAHVAHAARTAVAAGCQTIVLTNASGSLRPEVVPGDMVVIGDHLNLTGRSPMEGVPTTAGTPSPFTDLVDTWSPHLRRLAQSMQPSMTQGVYAQLGGPQFETPAEIRMLRTLGADLVGMSSVLEAIAARQSGAEVLGLSLVTNLAAGLEPNGVSATEIVDIAHRRATDVGHLIRKVVVAL